MPVRVDLQARGTFIPLSVSHLCGTILVPSYSMVWDWRISRAEPMPFICLAARAFCQVLISLSLLSFYGLVLWGWGIRTDMVLIALSRPRSANLF